MLVNIYDLRQYSSTGVLLIEVSTTWAEEASARSLRAVCNTKDVLGF